MSVSVLHCSMSIQLKKNILFIFIFPWTNVSFRLTNVAFKLFNVGFPLLDVGLPFSNVGFQLTIFLFFISQCLFCMGHDDCFTLSNIGFYCPMSVSHSSMSVLGCVGKSTTEKKYQVEYGTIS